MYSRSSSVQTIAGRSENNLTLIDHKWNNIQHQSLHIFAELIYWLSIVDTQIKSEQITSVSIKQRYGLK